MNIRKISFGNFKSLYKSGFKGVRAKPTIDLSLEWEDGEQADIFRYDVHLTTPTDTDYWKDHSEAFSQNGEKRWGEAILLEIREITISDFS